MALSPNRLDREMNKFGQNGAVDVNVQDQTSPTFDLFFSETLDDTLTLANDAIIDAYSIDLNAGHGAQVGDQLAIYNLGANRIYIGDIIAVNVDTIELDTPINFTYDATTSVVVRTTKELNVDGSTTRRVFKIEPPIDLEIDITRIMLKIICSSPPEFSMFGDIAGGLSRGVVMRRTDGTNTNYFNVKTNGELANLMYDVAFYDQTKTQGVNGVTGRLTYGGQGKHGAVIRLAKNERLEIIIQDDLTSLNSFRIIASGHLTID